MLELGAGQGLPGLLAYHLGAAQVVLTDFVPRLVETMADSASLAMAQSSGASRDGVERPGVTAALLDWQVEARDAKAGVPAEDTFQVLLASDVVYAVEHAVSAPCQRLRRAVSYIQIAHLGPGRDDGRIWWPR